VAIDDVSEVVLGGCLSTLKSLVETEQNFPGVARENPFANTRETLTSGRGYKID
jgi:hypothetical protein